MLNETAHTVLKTYDALLASFLQYPAAQVYDFGVLPEDLLATSRGCSLEKMSMNSASKETLRQSQYRLSDKYSVVSVDTGKVLPLLGVGELHASFKLNSENALTTNHLQFSNHQTFHEAESRDTGIYVRMLSSTSLRVVPFINSIPEESLFRSSGRVAKILRSAFGGVTDVILYNLQDSESSDPKSVVVFEAKEGSSQDLTEVKLAVESQIQSTFIPEDKPVHFITLDSIPRIGKDIDDAALTCLLNEKIGSESAMSSKQQQKESLTRNTLLEDLRDIYSRLSSVSIEQLQPRTSIFQLGFDSISAIQISSQLRSRGRHISAATIIENPTIEELIKFTENDYIKEDIRSTTYDFTKFEHDFWSGCVKVYPKLQENIEIVRPCTSMQEGLLSQFMSSRGRKYFNYFQYVSSSELDKTNLCHAWEEVISHHPILRTGFIPLTSTDRCFAMVIYRAGSNKPPVEIRFNSKDLHHELQNLLSQSAEFILNNLHLPPWRVMISSNNGKTAIHIFALHALYDAHSIQIILDDLDSMFSGYKLERTKSFDPLLGKLLSNASEKEALAEEYWMSVKDDVIVSAFPVLTTTREKTFQAYSIRRVQSQSSAVRNQACQEANITVQAVAQVAWSRLLAAYLGVQDVTFGVVLSGRTDVKDQDIAFPCISTVPFTANVKGSDTELLQQAMSWNKGMLKYQHASLTKIQRWIGRSNENLFDTVLVYQKSLSKSHKNRSWRIANEVANTEVRQS